AGQVAEQMVIGDTTNGASDDINRATEIARHMVCDWGMGGIGPLALGKKNGDVFLGREITQSRSYSDQTAVKIDNEMRRIIETCRNRAVTILKDNEDLMHRMAEALLEYETLDREQINKLAANEPLEPIKTDEEMGLDNKEIPPVIEQEESFSVDKSASGSKARPQPADPIVKDEPTGGI
ncbi:MAG: cell division protein FtsH, partial [Gemmatimonadota bacterium]|nr:cell division protein FtsH [Gemmatimonadota bacterium]